MKPLKILLAGTPEFAKIAFEEIHKENIAHNENIEFVGLLTQQDKPSGRKMQLKAPICKEFFSHHFPHLPILQPQRVDSQTLRGLEIDLILVVAYGCILPQEVLELAPCVNIHASLLPHLRGASPLQQMILEDLDFFGVSVMQMEKGLDSGAVLGFGYIKNIRQDIQELESSLAKLGARVFLRALKEKILPLKQCSADSTYCKKIKKEQGLVRFNDAREIFNAYRAFRIWPSVFCENRLKLSEILGFENEGQFRAGEILEITKDFVRVGCERGSLKIAKIQPPSKNAMSAFAYLQGARLQVGDILGTN